MTRCQTCGSETNSQFFCHRCGLAMLPPTPEPPGIEEDRQKPLRIWTIATLIAMVPFAAASMFFIGFGAGPEVIRVFWGPAVGWLIAGGLALEWKLNPNAEMTRTRLWMLVVAVGFFSLAILRILVREN